MKSELFPLVPMLEGYSFENSISMTLKVLDFSMVLVHLLLGHSQTEVEPFLRYLPMKQRLGDPAEQYHLYYEEQMLQIVVRAEVETTERYKKYGKLDRLTNQKQPR